MAPISRTNLKLKFKAGLRPKEVDFEQLIESSVNIIDDKASIAEAQNETITDKFITPQTVKSSVLHFAPVKTVNGVLPNATTGDVVLPTVTTISGNAGTATKLQNAVNINGVSFDGSANIQLPEDSTIWQDAIISGFSTMTTFSVPRFRKKNGVIYLEGVITGGTVQATPYLFFTLPLGLRPSSKLVFSVMHTNNTIGRVDVNNDGKVYGVLYNNAAGVGLSFNGISFALNT